MSFTDGSVGTAPLYSFDASDTEERDPSPSSYARIEQKRTAAMLAIPRPRTRADCLQEARPCPWVGCTHHLLLEVEESEGDRAPNLILNRPTHRPGPRRGLPSSAAGLVVDLWIDDAIEQLFRMRRTCELDVLDERGAKSHPNALATPLNNKEVAELLHVRKQTIRDQYERARSIVRDALELEER